MTSGSGGGTPPPPDDDPLLRPASDDGWDDEPKTKPDQPRAAAPVPAVVPVPAVPETTTPAMTTPATTSTTSATTPTTSTTPPSASTTPAEAKAAADDEPILPATSSENELRAAVGATPRAEPGAVVAPARSRYDDSDDTDDEFTNGRPRNRTAITVAVVSLIAGVTIGALVLLGRANSSHYVLACEAERAVAQQGRSFPPWGTRALEGEAWRPLKIVPETRCQPHETDDVLDLQRRYLAMLLEQATALLTAREVTKLDDAESLLKQAMLLTRPAEHEPAPKAAERAERHKDVERLLGDVTYWRAAGKLRDAAAALADAAKQFDTASEQRPRHMSDAPAWASYARKLVEELHAGPVGATRPLVGAPAAPGAAPSPAAAAPTAPSPPPAASNPERPAAPMGTALPVEPGQPATATGSGAPSPNNDPPSVSTPEPATQPSDPRVPSGGVLL